MTPILYNRQALSSIKNISKPELQGGNHSSPQTFQQVRHVESGNFMGLLTVYPQGEEDSLRMQAHGGLPPVWLLALLLLPKPTVFTHFTFNEVLLCVQDCSCIEDTVVQCNIIGEKGGENPQTLIFLGKTLQYKETLWKPGIATVQ